MNDDVLADLRTTATKPHKHRGYQPKLFDHEEEGTEDEARCTLTRTSSNASKNRVSELSWEDMEELTRARCVPWTSTPTLTLKAPAADATS